MKTYTVIWRDQGDDYMFTEVNTTDNPADLSSLNWIQSAASVEYASYPADELAEILDDLAENGYDLLNVVEGSLTYIL